MVALSIWTWPTLVTLIEWYDNFYKSPKSRCHQKQGFEVLIYYKPQIAIMTKKQCRRLIWINQISRAACMTVHLYPEIYSRRLEISDSSVSSSDISKRYQMHPMVSRTWLILSPKVQWKAMYLHPQIIVALRVVWNLETALIDFFLWNICIFYRIL